MIFDKHLSLQSECNKALGASGYYVATVGNVTEEIIKTNFGRVQSLGKT